MFSKQTKIVFNDKSVTVSGKEPDFSKGQEIYRTGTYLNIKIAIPNIDQAYFQVQLYNQSLSPIRYVMHKKSIEDFFNNKEKNDLYELNSEKEVEDFINLLNKEKLRYKKINQEIPDSDETEDFYIKSTVLVFLGKCQVVNNNQSVFQRFLSLIDPKISIENVILINEENKISYLLENDLFRRYVVKDPYNEGAYINLHYSSL